MKLILELVVNIILLYIIGAPYALLLMAGFKVTWS